MAKQKLVRGAKLMTEERLIKAAATGRYNLGDLETMAKGLNSHLANMISLAYYEGIYTLNEVICYAKEILPEGVKANSEAAQEEE